MRIFHVFLLVFLSMKVKSEGVSVNTEIATHHGDIPVELLDLGYNVIAYHNIFCLEKSFIYEVVIDHMKTITIYTNAKNIRVTQSQKIMTIDGWKNVIDLKIHDPIMTRYGSRLITSLVENEEPEKVFTLKLTPHETFFGNDFLLKN